MLLFSSPPRVLCAKVVSDKAEAENKIKTQQAAKPPPPSVDAKGRERWHPDYPYVDLLVEKPVAAGEEAAEWYWFQQTSLTTLNLMHNQISDAVELRKCLLLGNPAATMLLKGNPAYEKLTYVPEKGAVVGWQID